MERFYDFADVDFSGNYANEIEVQGKVVSEIVSEHVSFGTAYYDFFLEVPRLSGTVDILPITISQKLIDKEDLTAGKEIALYGQLRSRNHLEDGKSKLKLYVFAKRVLRNFKTENNSFNRVHLKGAVCKPPEYRKTPFGRDVADVIIAINRNGNCDYIPCVLWGENARFSTSIDVGDILAIRGRFQSREYNKQYSETDIRTLRAYELSCAKIALCNKK